MIKTPCAGLLKRSAGSITAPCCVCFRLRCWKMIQYLRFLFDSSAQPLNFTSINTFSFQTLPLLLICCVREASRRVFCSPWLSTHRLTILIPGLPAGYNCQFICYLLCFFPPGCAWPSLLGSRNNPLLVCSVFSGSCTIFALCL